VRNEKLKSLSRSDERKQCRTEGGSSKREQKQREEEQKRLEMGEFEEESARKAMKLSSEKHACPR